MKIWIVMPTDKDRPDKDRMAVQPAGALGNDIALAVMRRCLFSKKLRSETQLQEEAVTRHFRFSALVLVLALPYVGIAAAQESDYPLMEKIADKVVQKYRTTSCQDLAAQKIHPSTGKQAQMEKRAVEVLHQDPKLRAEFLKRVAAPIADKMFQCGMIP